MNERIGNNKIYLLAKEVGLIEFERLDWNPELQSPTQESVSKAHKFAQLIVQDCISQIALIGISNFENDDISWAVDLAIKNIQEKFGVTDENTNRSAQG